MNKHEETAKALKARLAVLRTHLAKVERSLHKPLPADSEEQAVKMANNSVYGLAASVWTGNLRRAHRVADALHAGTVSVNTVDALGINVPFGGFKQSGTGRDRSLHSIEGYTNLKTTWIQL